MLSRLPLRRTVRRTRHGVAAVEFAVVAPLFLLLLAGIIEFGQAFRIQHMLSIACRRGARAAIVESAKIDRVNESVREYCIQTLGVKEKDVQVVFTVNGAPAADLKHAEEGDEIGVTVSVPYAKAGAGFYAYMFSNATLTTSCLLEHE